MTSLPSIDDMDYASSYEKAYGVNNERLRFLAWHQDNLRRFDRLPIYDASLNNELERLRAQRDELASLGHNPRVDAGSAAEAFLAVQQGSFLRPE